jgi:cobaltochelatase CobS
MNMTPVVPDVMFVIQRVLEVEGKPDPARPEPRDPSASGVPPVCDRQHHWLGDTSGLYHGTQQINQGQMDRWNIVAVLNYLPHDDETKIVLAKLPSFAKNEPGAS